MSSLGRREGKVWCRGRGSGRGDGRHHPDVETETVETEIVGTKTVLGFMAETVLGPAVGAERGEIGIEGGIGVGRGTRGGGV